jgi:hypothetical protein
VSDGTQTLDQAAPAEVETQVNPEPVNLEAPALETPAPAEEEHEEIDFDGAKYRVPKKLKDGFLMQADYTRKTQEVAAERKALETAQQTVKQQAEVSQAHAVDVGRYTIIGEQLAQYDKIDWTTLNQQDPFKAQELFQQRQLLKEQRDGLVARIQENEHKRSQETQQDFAKRYAETNESLGREIKGWNQDLANKLADFARQNGATDQDIRTLAVNLPLVKLLHKAFLGDQLIATKQTAAQAAEPKVEPTPLVKVSGAGARPASNLFDADMETFVAERKKQGFGKR